MNLLVFILGGLLLFFFFRLMRRISRSIMQKRSLKKGSMTVLPLTELVLWIAYAFWGVYVLFGGQPYLDLVVGAMVVILLVAIAWFVFRDFLAGVLLKAEKSLECGQMIRTPYGEGRIMQVGGLSLEIINDAGEVVRIPYARLSSELFILLPADDDSLPHHLQLPLPAGRQPDNYQRMVEKQLMDSPWIIPPEPVVKIIQTTDDQQRLQVTFYASSALYALKVKEKLKKLLSEQQDSDPS